MTSREDTAIDVFARLGAGTVEPAPGGSIREYSGKVRIKMFHNTMLPLLILFTFFQTKLSNPLNCTHVVEGHSNSVLAVKVHNNNLFSAAAGKLTLSQ